CICAVSESLFSISIKFRLYQLPLAPPPPNPPPPNPPKPPPPPPKPPPPPPKPPPPRFPSPPSNVHHRRSELPRPPRTLPPPLPPPPLPPRDIKLTITKKITTKITDIPPEPSDCFFRGFALYSPFV